MSDGDAAKVKDETIEESFDDTNVDNQSTENEAEGSEDPELEAIKARVRDMEEEAEKLRAMNDEVEKQMSTTGKEFLFYSIVSVSSSLHRSIIHLFHYSFFHLNTVSSVIFSTRRPFIRRENGSRCSINLRGKCKSIIKKIMLNFYLIISHLVRTLFPPSMCRLTTLPPPMTWSAIFMDVVL